MKSPHFERYVGVDYSGAATPDARLPGLRAYEASRNSPPREVRTPRFARNANSSAKHWTRRGLAGWLVETLSDGPPTLVGIDHAFSFPLAYFDMHGLARDWDAFLDDFRQHWPTDDEHMRVEFVRRGDAGDGAERGGNARWRRLAETRAGSAKSVFHFDVPGSVAKSTHAGLPWLRFIRRRAAGPLHFWPFDGWQVARGHSAVAEVYPSLWSPAYPRGDLTADQHDAYSVAAWLRQADGDGRLGEFLEPRLNADERGTATIEGWILGVR